VSFDDEPLILVDADDKPVGFETKQRCHAGEGLLHRAFSVFLFDAAGKVVLQQRSSQKPLWPGIWSNACCSHPRRGESVDEAVVRRLREELGAADPTTYVFKFRYHARYGAVGAEHELCHVYVGRQRSTLRVNANEIAAVKVCEPTELDRELETRPDAYSPWLSLEWRQLRTSHWPTVEALLRD
jgi:isopentenyl-diphosphate delta-isomerase